MKKSTRKVKPKKTQKRPTSVKQVKRKTRRKATPQKWTNVGTISPAKKKKTSTAWRVGSAIASGARAAGKGVVDYFEWVDRQNARRAVDSDGGEYVWYRGRWVRIEDLPERTSSRYMPYPQSNYPVVLGDNFDLEPPRRRSRAPVIIIEDDDEDEDDLDELEDLLDDSPRSWHKELSRNSRKVARRNDAGSIMSAGVDDIMNVGYNIL